MNRLHDGNLDGFHGYDPRPRSPRWRDRPPALSAVVAITRTGAGGVERPEGDAGRRHDGNRPATYGRRRRLDELHPGPGTTATRRQQAHTGAVTGGRQIARRREHRGSRSSRAIDPLSAPRPRRWSALPTIGSPLNGDDRIGGCRAPV